jgi:hypothetical protein
MLQSSEGKMERGMQQCVWSDSDEWRGKAENQGEGHRGRVSESQVNREDMWQEWTSTDGHK